MSKEPSDSVKKTSREKPLADLSSLDFGPAWARKDSGKKKPSGKSERSDGNVSRPQSSRSKGKYRQDSGQGERGRSQGGRGAGRPQGGGKASRHRRQDREPHRVSPSPAEGVSARIMPIEEGMDGMAKEIAATGRTHSVFDLAWLVLGGPERYHVIFDTEAEALFKCLKDHSVWLTREECLRHFWSSGLVREFYEVEVTEGEAPAGNFQSVARCGLSGKLIGPPNHHSYQQVLMDLHRELFSSMPLESYKAKIKVEHGEEAVEQWIEQEKKQTNWMPKALAVEVDEGEQKTDSGAPAEPAIQADSPAENVAEGDALDSPSADASEVECATVRFSKKSDVEQHFIEHGFSKAYFTGKSVSTLATISPELISPSLLATMRVAVAEEKRYPGKLASFLCRQMTGRHLAVFKWKKRLHCGPARPKQVPSEMVIADRPSKLFQWVSDHSAGKIDAMWKDCLPADVEDETRHAWYHDLHWLINEGLVLLFSDGTLHVAKEFKKNTQGADKAGSMKKAKPSATPQLVDPAKPAAEESDESEAVEKD